MMWQRVEKVAQVGVVSVAVRSGSGAGYVSGSWSRGQCTRGGKRVRCDRKERHAGSRRVEWQMRNTDAMAEESRVIEEEER